MNTAIDTIHTTQAIIHSKRHNNNKLNPSQYMPSNTHSITVRNIKHNVHEWGNPELPTLFTLHGWMDCGASFEFIAEHLKNDFHIIAPDLRGYGDTEHVPTGYWLPDYIADTTRT